MEPTPSSSPTTTSDQPKLTLEFREGKQGPDTPPNFMVLMKVTAQDGTEYAVGYNKHHFKHGLPWIVEKSTWLKQPTFRRITLKVGEKRLVAKAEKALLAAWESAS